MAKDENGKWVTIKGTPVFIKEGQSLSQAFANRKKNPKSKKKTSEYEKFVANENKYLDRERMERIIDRWSSEGFEEGKYHSPYGKGVFHQKYASGFLEGYGREKDDFVIRSFDLGSVPEKEALDDLNDMLSEYGYKAKYLKEGTVHQDIEIKKIKPKDNKKVAKQTNNYANEKYKEYYKQEHLGEPKTFQKGDKVLVHSSIGKPIEGEIVREATDDEKMNINSNLKGYVVRDKLGNESVRADIRLEPIKPSGEDDFERWKEDNNEKIASYYTETYSDDLKNINEYVWNSIAKDIYDEEKLPEKINREAKEAYNNSEWLKKQGHDIQLEKKLEKFKPSGDIEKDTRRLEDISSNYFYDEVGIYNENIEEVCKEWARDSARKINATKETNKEYEELSKYSKDSILNTFAKYEGKNLLEKSDPEGFPIPAETVLNNYLRDKEEGTFEDYLKKYKVVGETDDGVDNFREFYNKGRIKEKYKENDKAIAMNEWGERQPVTIIREATSLEKEGEYFNPKLKAYVVRDKAGHEYPELALRLRLDEKKKKAELRKKINAQAKRRKAK